MSNIPCEFPQYGGVEKSVLEAGLVRKPTWFADAGAEHRWRRAPMVGVRQKGKSRTQKIAGSDF